MCVCVWQGEGSPVGAPQQIPPHVCDSHAPQGVCACACERGRAAVPKPPAFALGRVRRHAQWVGNSPDPTFLRQSQHQCLWHCAPRLALGRAVGSNGARAAPAHTHHGARDVVAAAGLAGEGAAVRALLGILKRRVAVDSLLPLHPALVRGAGLVRRVRGRVEIAKPRVAGGAGQRRC